MKLLAAWCACIGVGAPYVWVIVSGQGSGMPWALRIVASLFMTVALGIWLRAERGKR